MGSALHEKHTLLINMGSFYKVLRFLNAFSSFRRTTIEDSYEENEVKLQNRGCQVIGIYLSSSSPPPFFRSEDLHLCGGLDSVAYL